MTRFNKETLLIDKANGKVFVTAFTSGLKRGEFLFSIYKNNPKTMAEVLSKATKYMNVEDAMIARGTHREKGNEGIITSRQRKKVSPNK